MAWCLSGGSCGRLRSIWRSWRWFGCSLHSRLFGRLCGFALFLNCFGGPLRRRFSGFLDWRAGISASTCCYAGATTTTNFHLHGSATPLDTSAARASTPLPCDNRTIQRQGFARCLTTLRSIFTGRAQLFANLIAILRVQQAGRTANRNTTFHCGALHISNFHFEFLRQFENAYIRHLVYLPRYLRPVQPGVKLF